ncbi:MAG: hypothetical protein PHD54_14045 [Desulfuromonadaceae bacterium]|nr:hypothetical protein [Desulfuromonadaceae bacterium]
MKILLIQPPGHYPLMDQIYMFEPLALEYLAAGALLDGHEARICDVRIEYGFENVFREFAPDLVGLTGLFPR